MMAVFPMSFNANFSADGTIIDFRSILCTQEQLDIAVQALVILRTMLPPDEEQIVTPDESKGED